ncbi:hypothetical protein BT63DRAFT_115447 [Microthyrium microscopicum]|uniref:Protein kinase domain-containing protein n=1 Tax=Microthyrium microscopicum TaxID=703497 RepID=A0A6A6TV27_9PEZI|nr:hypothetical protein BT63DRAFT_115447 [Microthyrium microscopicum]
MPHEEENHQYATSLPHLDDPDSALHSPAMINIWSKARTKVQSWLKGDGEEEAPRESRRTSQGYLEKEPAMCDEKEQDVLRKNPSRKVLPGLSRPLTFTRQNSERRDRLFPYQPDADERRALSVDRRIPNINTRAHSPPPQPTLPSRSAPDISSVFEDVHDEPIAHDTELERQADRAIQQVISPLELSTVELREPQTPQLAQHPSTSLASIDQVNDDHERLLIQAELEAKWILNLSMHFKDRSDREKFFVTYAQEPNKWRRLTVSCDYRNPSPDSLEEDLKSLKYQQDKSARIYESIRDSLLDIQFYSTVTNLKLKTMDGRLHVHCSEDLNEVISYPRTSMLNYLACPLYRESEVLFESHMSGFVYKVNVDGRILVKKEIPGPEAVDEFLYEIAALSALKDAKNVISFEGLVVDEDETVVKGLLISLATQGALVDIIYDMRYSNTISWNRRERWARQIVQGLSDVHEAGFVQGDFTLSNIVADSDDNVYLIDVNRRGCPVGWEPPELEEMIRAGQRISMFIGVKTDLFQLGMVLWALAMCIDEPELEPRPLRPVTNSDIPDYFRQMVEICLDPNPQHRVAAKDLLKMFPLPEEIDSYKRVDDLPQVRIAEPTEDHSDMVQYIDPEEFIEDDLRRSSRSLELKAPGHTSEVSSIRTIPDATAASSEYLFDDRDLPLDRRLPRDASPFTQSESERPRTRGESDFGSTTGASLRDTPAVNLASSTIDEERSFSSGGSNEVLSKHSTITTAPEEIHASVSTLAPQCESIKHKEQAESQSFEHSPVVMTTSTTNLKHSAPMEELPNVEEENPEVATFPTFPIREETPFAPGLEEETKPTNTYFEPLDSTSESTSISTMSSTLSTPKARTPAVRIDGPSKALPPDPESNTSTSQHLSIITKSQNPNKNKESLHTSGEASDIPGAEQAQHGGASHNLTQQHSILS